MGSRDCGLPGSTAGVSDGLRFATLISRWLKASGLGFSQAANASSYAIKTFPADCARRSREKGLWRVGRLRRTMFEALLIRKT